MRTCSVLRSSQTHRYSSRIDGEMTRRSAPALHAVRASSSQCAQVNANTEVTDFRRAVKAEPDEQVVFSFKQWPSRKLCDAAAKNITNDGNMKPAQGMQLSSDMKRMHLRRIHPNRDVRRPTGRVRSQSVLRGLHGAPIHLIISTRGMHRDRYLHLRRICQR